MEVISMNRYLSLVLLAACGSVTDPVEPSTAAAPVADPSSPSAQAPSHPAIQIEEPRAATAQASLRGDELTTAVGGVKRGPTGADFVDLVEQRIVTLDVEPVLLTVELPCVRADVPVNDPACLRAAAIEGERTTLERLAATEWSIALIDDHAGVEVPGCSAARQATLHCELPTTAGAYRIVVRGRGMTTGASGQLELDPITIRVTANGTVTERVSPALSWSLAG